MRRIVSRHWKQISVDTLEALCSTILNFLAQCAALLPMFLFSSAAQLLARVLRVSWGATADLRAVAAAPSEFLLLSPAHCTVAMLLWTELATEFGSVRPTDAATKIADLSFADMRRATQSFGSGALLQIFQAAVSVVYDFAAGTLAFQAPGDFSAPQQQALLRGALSLLLACLRYDFHSLNSDDWADDAAFLMLPNSKPWREALEAPRLQQALWAVVAGVGPADDETPRAVLEVVIALLSYRQSSWSNGYALTRALRHAMTGLMPVLAALASSDPAEGSGQPLLCEEPELFNTAARLVFRITSAFSWGEVMEALNPSVPGPLVLVALPSPGPQGMGGLVGATVPAAQVGITSGPCAGQQLPVRPVSETVAVVDTQPPSAAVAAAGGAVSSAGPVSGAVATAASAVAVWLTATRDLTSAAVAAATEAAGRGDSSQLVSPALLQLLAFWAKATEAANAGGANPVLQHQIFDAAMGVMSSYISARFAFIASVTAPERGLAPEEVEARLGELTEEPGYSEQLLSLAMIARLHPTGAAYALVGTLERDLDAYRGLVSYCDQIPADGADGRARFALSLLACETQLAYLVALSAAVLTPDRLGGPRPASLPSSSLLLNSLTDFPGVSVLRSLFGLDAPAPPAKLSTAGVAAGAGKGASLSIVSTPIPGSSAGRFPPDARFRASTPSSGGSSAAAAAAAAAAASASGSLSASTGGLTGTNLFLALLNASSITVSAASAAGGTAAARSRAETQHALDVAEVVLTVTVWAVLPLLPVRLGVLTAAAFSDTTAAAAGGFAALRAASEVGGGPDTAAAAGAGAGACAHILSLLSAEIVATDPATGEPVVRPGWGPHDGAFEGVNLRGIPAPVDPSRDIGARGGGGSGSSGKGPSLTSPPATAEAAAAAAAAAEAKTVGEAFAYRVPLLNPHLPPRSAALDLGLLAFVRAFSQRYCTVSQLRHTRSAATAPVFPMIGETLAWIRPLPSAAARAARAGVGAPLPASAMASPATSMAGNNKGGGAAGGAAGAGAFDGGDFEFFDEEVTDWTADDYIAMMFPAPTSPHAPPQSPLAKLITFNARDAVGVLTELLTGTIYYWAHPAHRKEPVLAAALELLHDMASTYSIASALWGLPAAAALINAHTVSPLGRDTRLAPYRRLFYESITRITLRARPVLPRLATLQLPLDAGFGVLAAELQQPAPDARAAVLAHGLCVAVHGMFEACESRTSYMAVFNWAFPDYVALLTQAVEAYWAEADVLDSVLALFSEMSDNRCGRIYFPPTAPGGVLFFKACALVVETYCTRAAGVRKPTSAAAAAVAAAAAATGAVGGLGISATGAVVDSDDDDNGDGDDAAGTAVGASGAAGGKGGSGGGGSGSGGATANERYSHKIKAAGACLELAYRCLDGGFCPLGALEAFHDPSVDRMLSSVVSFLLTIDTADVLSRPDLVNSLYKLLNAAFESAPGAVLKLPPEAFVRVVGYLAAAIELFSGFPAGHALARAYGHAVEALSHLFEFTRTTSKELGESPRDEAFLRGGVRSGARGRRLEAQQTVRLLQRQVAGAITVLSGLLAHVLTQFIFETGEVRGVLTRVTLPFIYTCSVAWAGYVDALARGAADAAADAGFGSARGPAPGALDAGARIAALQQAAAEISDLAARVCEGAGPDGAGDDDDGTSAGDNATMALMRFRETVVQLVRRPAVL
jgi:hypothetical protein